MTRRNALGKVHHEHVVKKQVNNYKNAFVFFLLAILGNLILTPILIYLGAQVELSLFIANSVSMSTSALYVMLIMNQVFKESKKKAWFLVGAVTLITTILCYYFIYLVSF